MPAGPEKADGAHITWSFGNGAARKGGAGKALARACAAVALGALVVGCGGAVDVSPPHPSAAAKRACHALSSKLPQKVAGESHAETSPKNALTAAWGSPPITLRCGVGLPDAYSPTAQLFTVNGVDWLPAPQGANPPTRFYVMGRRAYVELVVPKEHSPAANALVDLAHAIKAADPKDPSAKP
ncbi:MAG: DUF3515 domain-containing protein [Streptosporangiales bacterium]